MKRLRNRKRGAAIVDTAAALTLLLPVAMLMIYVAVEVSYAYLIKASLAQGARQAARGLAVAYGQNPLVANDRSLQESMVFDHIRLHNIISANEQFDNPVFDTTASPHTVYVLVHYRGGQYGLPDFPNPDPLGIRGYVQLNSDSTYRLE